ncbi:Filamin/ABP280 repeat protein [Ostertagia ostertagi]
MEWASDFKPLTLIALHPPGVFNLACLVHGPCRAKNKCIDNSDGTCSVEYVPPVPGEYTIGICYGKDEDKQHIHGSPFRVIADMPNDPSRIAVSGLRPDTLLEARVGSPVSFSIDASQTEEAPISVTVPPIYQQPLLERERGSKRLYRARFTPVGEPGSVIPVEIMYDGKPIPSSPYRIKLLPETEVNKVKVCGSDGLSGPLDIVASRPSTAC